MPLRENLLAIEKLEQEHGFLGVRMMTRESARGLSITAEDLSSHVLEILRHTVELERDRVAGKIPFADEVGP